jgi:hypothetical protein
LTSFKLNLGFHSYPRRQPSGAKRPGTIFHSRLEHKPLSSWFAQMKVLSTYSHLIGRMGGHTKDSKCERAYALLEASGKYPLLALNCDLTYFDLVTPSCPLLPQQVSSTAT